MTTTENPNTETCETIRARALEIMSSGCNAPTATARLLNYLTEHKLKMTIETLETIYSYHETADSWAQGEESTYLLVPDWLAALLPANWRLQKVHDSKGDLLRVQSECATKHRSKTMTTETKQYHNFATRENDLSRHGNPHHS